MPVNTDHLLPDESLGPDQSVSSLNGRYTFVYQGDGNLVLYKNYRNQDRRPLWASGTDGQPTGSCVMQGDGNLVIYDPNGQPLWASNTQQPGSRLLVQDDGNVVIYLPNGTPVWATDTMQPPLPPAGTQAQGADMQPGEALYPDQALASANGRYRFILQRDGNLVLCRNRDGRPLWASATDGRPVEQCLMQGDGHLVIYDGDGQATWGSGTWENPGSRLVVQDDGNVVIYRPDDTPVWATNTMQSGWFRCQVMKTGPADDGKIYIALRNDTGGAFHHWFSAFETYKKEMLATALTAMSTGLPVDAALESTDEYSTIMRLYVVR